MVKGMTISFVRAYTFTSSTRMGGGSSLVVTLRRWSCSRRCSSRDARGLPSYPFRSCAAGDADPYSPSLTISCVEPASSPN